MKFNIKKRTFLSYFGILPYVTAYWLIRKLYSREAQGIYIWSRNSFELNYLEYGYSDLDLTLFTKDSVNKVELFELKRKIQRLKVIFPFIGEINVYSERELADMASYGNFFELSRDPKLFKQISNFQKKNVTPQAIVFILQQLERDLWMLNQCPDKRVKKWLFIYSLVDREIPEASLQTRIPWSPEKIVETMSCIVLHFMQVFNPDQFQQQWTKINFIMELIYKKVDFYKIPDPVLADPWFYLLSFEKRNISFQEILPNDLTPMHLEIIKEKVHWEIFGNYTQTSDIKKNMLVKTHFRSLQSKLETINTVYNSEKLAYVGQYLKSLTREN